MVKIPWRIKQMDMKRKEQTKKQMGKNIFKLILVSIIAVFGIKFIVNNKELFSFINTLTIQQFFICASLMIINMVVPVITDKILLNTLGIDIKWFDIIVVTFINSLLSCFIPFGGAYLIKGKYLKDKCDLSYAKFVALTVGAMIINMFVVLLEAMLALLFSKLDMGKLIIMECGLALVVITSICILWLLYKGNEKICKMLPFKEQVKSVTEGLYEIVANKKIIAINGLIYILNTICISVRFAYIFRFVEGQQLSIVDAIFYQSAYQVSSFVVLLPGNIGISEVLVGAANNLLGSGFDVGVAVTLINRMLYYIMCLVLGVLSWIAVLCKSMHQKRIDT